MFDARELDSCAGGGIGSFIQVGGRNTMSKGMEGGVSRRSFLKGAGVAAAAVAGSAALAGCASG